MRGYIKEGDGKGSTTCDAIMCDTGYRVQNHKCVACRSGKYNTENHDASGEDTECQWITCDENEYAYINGDTKQCSACPAGTYNVPGDSLSAQVSTKCDAIMCDIGYRVQNHTCQLCEPGKYNPENHDASGPDTYCQSVLCDENEYVSGNQCLACPPGTYNAPGDDASIINTNTACDAIMCDTGYRVQNHTCVGCRIW